MVPDEELIERIQRQDERALEMLYERYGRAAYSLALRMLRDPARAEEVVQEVFLKVWRRPSSYVAARGPFGTWLLSVTHHRAIDDLRSRRHDTLPIDDVALGTSDLTDGTIDLADGAWLREQRLAVRRALALLPIPQRRALELAYYGGLTQREIADRLGEPLGTIKTRVRLALQKLRVGLDGLTDGGIGIAEPDLLSRAAVTPGGEHVDV